jgi:hypothetical protein
MALSSDDWSKMHDLFGGIRQEMREDRQLTESRMNKHSTSINNLGGVVSAAVSQHEEKHHDLAKKAGFVAVVVGLAVGVLEGGKAVLALFGGQK